MIQLFETALTTDDIEKSLQDTLGTTSKFGENVSFTDLGNGNVSFLQSWMHFYFDL